MSFRYDTFKTGNCLSALEIVKKEPCRILSSFIKGLATVTIVFIRDEFFLYDILCVSFSWFECIIPEANIC